MPSKIKLKAQTQKASIKIEESKVVTPLSEEKSHDSSEAIKEWRKYFTQDELVLAYSQINAGIDPNDEEVKEESDSNPSEDNLSPEEMDKFLLSLPKPHVLFKVAM